jgi:hypothetical protein
MQIDSHYYATYCLARAAGLAPEVARTIATCAQFVDDNVAKASVEFRDGSRVDVEATAHHTVDNENLEAYDQRQVWVPFHFLPGNEGETFTERLKCRKDSAIAREMVEHHLALADKPFAVALIGIAAHVYADTFSHYGFAGVSSRGNQVVNDSFEFDDKLDPEIREYITAKQARFARKWRAGGLLTNIKSRVAEAISGALGHGSVATFPDRPYLKWRFEYERPDAVEGRRKWRDNRETFVEGFKALHGMFIRFATERPDLSSGDARIFADIEKVVREIVEVEAKCEGRVEAWQKMARSGRLFDGDGKTIPEYEGEQWNARWQALDGEENSAAISHHDVWRFYQAAAIHRIHVLRDLLPRHGLIVD